MLLPKKMKYRKTFRRRGQFGGKTKGNDRVCFGSYGLKAMTMSEVTSRQIEAARRSMTRYIKRGGKIWIRIFPHTPVTRKGAEVPMGSGKGTVDHYAFRVKPGMILFELDGVPEPVAREAMRLAGHKLPVKTKFVTQETI
ncbi:50S ribosomal protein L16 [Candidatus Peregrinibacteria bacterium]|jgi:large subunit ribosomal protein L16|nr:50S ribosomal protein L16 [Candidatus Peregrinibacteria bacterium]MBT7484429.1 50S ribosomal protein L16 [Candidatus Peregrinibacteria bacterium]MBT7703694.1 50S ribosomal protein L16 [Candidatus Peregrinibacteria bacterium]